MKITIKIENVISTVLNIDSNLLHELKEYLKVRPEGYNYSSAFRKRQWDGWRYFINSKGSFATGFLPLVYNFLAENYKDIELIDSRVNLPIMNENIDTELPNGWQIRDYQIESIKSVNNKFNGIYFPRGIIDAATNAGKNSICAGIFNNVHNPKLLFLLHSKTIFKQALEFFGELFPHDIGQIGEGRYKINNFTIAMVKTLYNKSLESINVVNDLNKFNMLIVDEAHKAGGEEYSKLLQKVNAGMRIFVSGTPLSNVSKINNMIIVGLSGPVIKKITNKELIENKHSLKPKVKILLNETISRTAFDYIQELKDVVHNSDNRAKLISDICVEKADKKILIAYIEISHGMFIKKAIENNPNFHGRIEIVHGKDASRYYKIKDFKDGKIDVLLTSTILKEGINIPNIEVLIMAQAGKSVITVKQFLGRALRLDGKNTEVEIFDFYDLGEYVSFHARQRLKIYREEGFDVELNYKEKRNKPVQYPQY